MSDIKWRYEKILGKILPGSVLLCDLGIECGFRLVVCETSTAVRDLHTDHFYSVTFDVKRWAVVGNHADE